MRSLLELVLKLTPLGVIAYLAYWLFISPDTSISEGMKLSASALLGGMVSYIFIQYSEFIGVVERKQREHQNALATLEFKLNEQLNWLSDVIYHLENHAKMLKRVMDGDARVGNDPSSYREPIDIQEETMQLTSLNFKYRLLGLLTTYKKLKNDLVTLHKAYDSMFNLAIADDKFYESYKAGLPRQLETTNIIRSYVAAALEETKVSLSICRVLAVDSRTPLASVRRFLVLHKDPKNLPELAAKERKLLDQEIADSLQKSTAEKERIERDITISSI